MNSQFIMHVTTAGERWDLLAWTFYGNPTLYSPIIMANPRIPIESVFEAGLELAIPILQIDLAQTSNLPPWKRSA
jgi:phage tail protein X